MWLVDVLVEEYVRVDEKIRVYKEKLADEDLDEDRIREFRSTLAYLLRQCSFIEKALAANGYDLEKLLLKWAAQDAIAQAHRAGITTTHGDAGGIYRLHPDGRKEYVKCQEKKK